MSPIARRCFRALFLAGLLSTLAPATPATASTCEFLQEDGTYRDCTFTERVGQCYYNALESYYDCLEMSDSLLDDLRCEAAVQIDLMACNLNTFGELVRLVSPV